MFLSFFLSLLLLATLLVSLMGLIFIQLPTSQSVQSTPLVIISSLVGSFIILETRFVILRHMRFATFYSLMQTAFTSSRILLPLLIMFIAAGVTASHAGIVLPESVVNRLVLLIFTLLIWVAALTFYTLPGVRASSRMLASACFQMASSERDSIRKVRWMRRGTSQMSKHFSQLGLPLNEASLNRSLLNRLLQMRNGDIVLESLSKQLTDGIPPLTILNRLDRARGVDLVDLESRSRIRTVVRIVNDYAPSLSILVTLIVFVLTYLRR